MSALNAESKRLLDTAFGSAGNAWLIRGRYRTDAAGQEKWHRLQEGPAGTFDLPDDEDLYYCVATVGPAGRTDVKRVHVLVIDDVGKEIDKDDFVMWCPLEPTFWVESSKGSYHVGFVIDGGMVEATFIALRQTMKAHPVWGKAHNISSAAIYRLPQGTHTKKARGGQKVREEAWTGAVHPVVDILEAFGGGAAAVAAQGSAPRKRFEWTLGDDALRALVPLIPNGVDAKGDDQIDRDTWIGVAHGIAGAGGDFELFEVFSQTYTGINGYDAAETARVWDTLPPSKSGGGVLRQLAERLNPKGFAAWKLKWETKKVFDDGPSEAEIGEELGERVLDAHQLAVADDIVRRAGHTMRFNVDTGLWHRFDGFIWRPSKSPLGFQAATAWARSAAPTLGKGMKAAVQKAGFSEAVENYLRKDVRLVVGEADFDKDPWLLGTPGGTVDLKTGKLRPALPGDMISRCTLVTPAEQEDCPVWKKKLIEWMTTVGGKADLEMQRFLKHWAGYSLSGDTSEEKLLFLYGDGSNGKGSYVETLSNIAGTYYQEPATDLFTAKKHARHQQEIAVLSGARMVACSEVGAATEWDDMLLKKVTGGGLISANFMRQNQFTFRVQFKVTISGNDKPAFPGRISQAIRRRFMLATFPNKANPVDQAFKPGLMKEAPGILRWAINGLVEMQSGGGLLVPTSVQDATDKYMDDEDLFGAWLADRTQKVAGGKESAKDLMANWIEYRNQEGNHTLVDSQRKFGEEMRRRGWGSKHTNAGWFYSDIILKSDAKTVF